VEIGAIAVKKVNCRQTEDVYCNCLISGRPGVSVQQQLKTPKSLGAS